MAGLGAEGGHLALQALYRIPASGPHTDAGPRNDKARTWRALSRWARRFRGSGPCRRQVRLAHLAQLEPLIMRPATDWIGRAFIGYMRENTATCSGETGTACCITIHSTPSLHGGVVSEPM